MKSIQNCVKTHAKEATTSQNVNTYEHHAHGRQAFAANQTNERMTIRLFVFNSTTNLRQEFFIVL